MRFNLKNDIIPVIKLNDARVVGENGDTPLRPNLLRRPLDERLKQPINRLRLLSFFGILNHALKGFVDTMLGPRLGDCFKFDIGGISLQLGEVGLDCLHLGEIQRQQPLLTDA